MADYVFEESDEGRVANPRPTPDDPFGRIKFNDLLIKADQGELTAADRSFMNSYDRSLRMKMSDTTKEDIKGFMGLFKDIPETVDYMKRTNLLQDIMFEQYGLQEMRQEDRAEASEERQERREERQSEREALKAAGFGPGWRALERILFGKDAVTDERERILGIGPGTGGAEYTPGRGFSSDDFNRMTPEERERAR